MKARNEVERLRKYRLTNAVNAVSFAQDKAHKARYEWYRLQRDACLKEARAFDLMGNKVERNRAVAEAKKYAPVTVKMLVRVVQYSAPFDVEYHGTFDLVREHESGAVHEYHSYAELHEAMNELWLAYAKREFANIL